MCCLDLTRTKPNVYRRDCGGISVAKRQKTQGNRPSGVDGRCTRLIYAVSPTMLYPDQPPAMSAKARPRIPHRDEGNPWSIVLIASEPVRRFLSTYMYGAPR